MRRMSLVALVMALMVPAGIWAQGKPNLSGTWALNMDKSDPPPARGGGGGGGQGGGGGRGGGGMQTIMQTATDITINMVAYKLDTPDQNVTIQGRGGPQQAKATTSWRGNTLVIEQTQDFNGMPVKNTREISLNSPNELQIVTTQVGPNGENKRKTVFDKQ